MGKAVDGGAVIFDDLAGEIGYQITLKEETATRTGRVAWVDLDALVDECFPSPPSLPGLLPGSTYVYVKSVDIKVDHPEPGNELVPGDVPTYSTANVTINYGPLDLGGNGDHADSDDGISRKWGVSAEFLTVEKVDLAWDNDDPVTTDGVTFGKIIPQISHSIDCQRVDAASVPYAAVRDLIGKVNDGTFEGAADETLLFTGAEISFKNVRGEQIYSLGYKFDERIVKQGTDQVGWNYFFRPDTGTWQKIKTVNGNHRIYPKGSFSALF